MLIRRVISLTAAILMLMIYLTITVHAMIMKEGDQGDHIIELQRMLIVKGFLTGNADGIYGEKTVNAIKKFQTTQGLEVDGICGDETYNLLLETIDTTINISESESEIDVEQSDDNYVIKYGMQGDDVAELHNILIALGYMDGVADGICGMNTVNAIKKFQSTHGLVADGICGTATFDLINFDAEEFTSGNVSNEKPTVNENNYSSEIAEIGSVIKPGMRGEGVAEVQRKLIENGFLTGRADGICGSRTVAAIKRFQESVGLEADGVCGLQTYAALENVGYNISDTSWNESIEETPTLGRSIYVEATAYSPFDPGLGSYTARGNVVRRGIIAVDPYFIPLGTRVYIPGYGEAIADDTGGAIRGNRIDIAFDTYEEAMHFGRQYMEIYILDN